MKWSDLWDAKTHQMKEPELKYGQLVDKGPGNIYYELNNPNPEPDPLYKWVAYVPPAIKNKIDLKHWASIVELQELPKLNWWTLFKLKWAAFWGR